MSLFDHQRSPSWQFSQQIFLVVLPGFLFLLTMAAKTVTAWTFVKLTYHILYFFFPFYRAVTTENLMYIKEDLIIPHVSNIRGKDSHSKKWIQKKNLR